MTKHCSSDKRLLELCPHWGKRCAPSLDPSSVFCPIQQRNVSPRDRASRNKMLETLQPRKGLVSQENKRAKIYECGEPSAKVIGWDTGSLKKCDFIGRLRNVGDPKESSPGQFGSSVITEGESWQASTSQNLWGWVFWQDKWHMHGRGGGPTCERILSCERISKSKTSVFLCLERFHAEVARDWILADVMGTFNGIDQRPERARFLRPGILTLRPIET